MTIVCTQRHSLNWICEYVGISRRAYHKRLRKQRAKEDLYQYAEAVGNKEPSAKVTGGIAYDIPQRGYEVIAWGNPI